MLSTIMPHYRLSLSSFLLRKEGDSASGYNMHEHGDITAREPSQTQNDTHGMITLYTRPLEQSGA